MVWFHTYICVCVHRCCTAQNDTHCCVSTTVSLEKPLIFWCVWSTQLSVRYSVVFDRRSTAEVSITLGDPGVFRYIYFDGIRCLFDP